MSEENDQSLAAIFADMQEALAGAGVTAESLLGARHLAANGAPPRYVWVPTTASYSGGRKVGNNSRELFAHDIGIAVHCWGESHDAALELHDAFIVAGRKKARASFVIKDGGFLNPLQDAWLKDGEVFVLVVTFPRAVAERARPKAHITAVEPSAATSPASALGDGKLDSGET